MSSAGQRHPQLRQKRRRQRRQQAQRGSRRSLRCSPSWAGCWLMVSPVCGFPPQLPLCVTCSCSCYLGWYSSSCCAHAIALKPAVLPSAACLLLPAGVEGVGAANSSSGLYNGEGGERGVVALQPIAGALQVERSGRRAAVGGMQCLGTPSPTTPALSALAPSHPFPADGPLPLCHCMLPLPTLRWYCWSRGCGDAHPHMPLRDALLFFLLFAVAGEVVMRIPMRLAITDRDYSTGDEEDEEEAAAAAGLSSYSAAQQAEDERPWSVRLAGKLLGMVAQGGACPWQPYLRVLPEQVPSPLTTFSWEDVQAIEVGRSRGWQWAAEGSRGAARGSSAYRYVLFCLLLGCQSGSCPATGRPVVKPGVCPGQASLLPATLCLPPPVAFAATSPPLCSTSP